MNGAPSSMCSASTRASAAMAVVMASSPALSVDVRFIEISRAGWLGRTSILARAVSSLRSLARANGWGSAGECPASACAKTPAVREPAISPGGSAHAAAGGGVG